MGTMGRSARWCGAALLVLTAVGTVPGIHHAAGAGPAPQASGAVASAAPTRPVPPLDPRAASQAAADRPDPFVPSSTRVPAAAIPQGKWRQLGTNPIGAQPTDPSDGIPPQYALGGGQD